MKFNNRKLKEFISPVSEKNKDYLYDEVLGVAIEKEFMPSVANLIGTDLAKYSVLRRGRFAYNPMHVGRDKKLPIALYKKDNPSLVSPAYVMFEVTNEELLPEYLEILVKSDTFDHLCWFHTDSSVRGGLVWDDFIDFEIPVPSIEEQKKIVHRYNVMCNRIKLLNDINLLLDENIQIIFKDFFDDIFVSPQNKLGDYVKCVLGGTPSRDEKTYWRGNIPWINSGKVNDFRISNASECITNEGLNNSSTKLMPIHTVVLAITGATLGQESITLIECCANQSVIGIIENENMPYMFIHPLIKAAMDELLKRQTGGAQEHICKDDVEEIKFNMPDTETIKSFVAKTKYNYELIELYCHEINKLNNIKDILVTSLI